MSAPILAQYHSFLDKEEFKKICEKNKMNRNSDCGGMRPSLHTGGSISMTEHRRRLKEKLGEEPSHAVLFQATHKRKNTGEFVCKKSQQIVETASQRQQTKPELDQEIIWYEAIGGLKKGRYVWLWIRYPTLLSREVGHRESSSHAASEERIKKLEQDNEEIK
ncbi:PREDICTED: uncharacterized protein LOC109153785 [Ipomoea nil]|uniref:uncharacterized protein LOC109153785 n=1 Tax=Ipomoea nil TaxID=35883 RepID=UPI00090151EE|nr:PREDICTED: uncharacterized protein LOC109153785 [Ipomoea nil]